MTNVTAIDALPGQGKTTHIIRRFNAAAAAQFEDADGLGLVEQDRFVYIAPYLAEVQRIKQAALGLRFVEPQPVGGRKLNHFNELLSQGRNVASTHALFRSIDRDTYRVLQDVPYVLVIDEALSVVETYDGLSKDDIRALHESEMIYVDDRHILRWNHAKWPQYSGRFNELMTLADNGSITVVNSGFLLWTFPVDFLALFQEVVVMTYLFDGSLMAQYLRAAGVQYTVMTLDADKQLVPADQRDERAAKEKLRKLITVIDHAKLNAIGTPKGREQPFSAGWLTRMSKDKAKPLTKVQTALSNYFKNIVKAQSSEAGWTTFKEVKAKLSGPGYAKGFIPVNAKATNEYVDRKYLAYLANVFMNPAVFQYLQSNGMEPDQELYALAELIQWVFRSQIRRGDPITLYIPSLRMRTLFLDWLNEGLEAEAEGELLRAA